VPAGSSQPSNNGPLSGNLEIFGVFII